MPRRRRDRSFLDETLPTLEAAAMRAVDADHSRELQGERITSIIADEVSEVPIEVMDRAMQRLNRAVRVATETGEVTIERPRMGEPPGTLVQSSDGRVFARTADAFVELGRVLGDAIVNSPEARAREVAREAIAARLMSQHTNLRTAAEDTYELHQQVAALRHQLADERARNQRLTDKLRDALEDLAAHSPF